MSEDNKKVYKAKVGFVMFDDTEQGDSAWASVSGETSYRINGINELDQNVSWITNISFNDFNKLNFRDVSYLKESHYMRVDPQILLKELSLQGDKSKATQAISKIYQRVVDFGYEHFGVSPQEIGYRYANILSEKVVPMSMRKKPKENRDAIESAIEEATQYFQKDVGKRPSGNTSITLTMPRIAYFNWLLDRQVPISNEWKKVSFNNGPIEVGVEKEELVKGTHTKMKKLAEMASDNALLFNISIKNMDKTYAKFASFGVGKNVARGWVSYPELIEMVRYSRIEIKKALKTKLGPIDESIKDKDQSTNFSFSKGIFLDNLASSVLTPIDRTTVNGITPYLRAYDRMACFRIAERLTEDGYYIMSYGMGKISISVPEKGINEIVSKALSWGLMPSLEVMKKIDKEELFVEDPSEEDKEAIYLENLGDYISQDFVIIFIKTLATHGIVDSDIIMDIDDILEYPASERNEKLEELYGRIAEQEDSEGEDSDNEDDEEIIDL